MGETVGTLIGLARSGGLYERERRALLDALGHGDCHPAAPGPVGFRENEALARAERAKRERDRLRERLEEAHLARIEAQNPGIDMEQVRRGREVFRSALSLDADADAEPKRPRCLTCEDTGLYPPGNDDGYGCWDCNQPPRRRDGTCAVCDQRRDPDAEPSRAEGECVCHRGRDEVKHCPHHTLADYDAQQRLRDQRYWGGDDGHTRAWQAMGRLLDDAEGDEVPVTELLQAALDSGGVVTREDWLEACDGELARANERDRVEGRLLALEAVIRDDIYPMIAGRVIELDHAGEDRARDRWNALCHRVLAALEGRDG